MGILEQQVERAYGQYSSRESPIGKNSFMTSMKYQNDVWTDFLEKLNAQLINCRPRFSITRYAKLLQSWQLRRIVAGKKLVTVFL